MPHPVSLAFTIVPTSTTFRASFHPLTMPRSPTLKIYDRFFLEKLSRSQIQAHAKHNNIKANGKTEAIISQLLGKEILTEEVPVSTVGRSTWASTRRNRTNVANPEGAGTAEQKLEVASIEIHPAPSPSFILQRIPTSVAFMPQTSNTKNSSATRRGTPYPQHSSGSDSLLDSPGGELTYLPASTSQAQAEIVPMRQTDKDVRVVRRKLTGLGNQQVYLQREIEDVETLLEYSWRDMVASAKSIEKLSWTRQAIEEVVMLELKDNRHLWDGTWRMGEKDGEAWQQFVEENWSLPRWRPKVSEAFVESDSSSIASSLENSDVEGEKTAREELLQISDNGVPVVDDSDEDDIYV